MNTQELLQKIDKLKAAFEGETDPELKDKFKNKIASLEKQVAEAEASVAKKEEVIMVKEEKKVDEVDERLEKLKKLKAAAESEDDPELKAKFQKKIDEIQAKIKDVKEEIKEEKKELKEVKEDVKEAVKEVKSAEKQVRKEAIKKVKEVKEVRDEVVKSKKKRSKKLDDILSDLDKAIAKSKKLTEKYKGAGVTKVDLERDAKRKAKPFGWRFKGDDDYRVPTLAQRRKNPDAVDYEARPNRADVKHKGKVLLAHGGETMMPEWAVTITSQSGETYDWVGFAKSEDDALYKAEQEAGFESVETGVNQLTDAQGNKIEYAKGGGVKDNTIYYKGMIITKLFPSGYYQFFSETKGNMRFDNLKEAKKFIDAELESLGIKEYAKGGAVHSRAKDAERTAKPKGWRWKNEAIEQGLIPKTARYKNPSKYYRNKYPDLVYYEARQSKSDKKPSIKYKSL